MSLEAAALIGFGITVTVYAAYLDLTSDKPMMETIREVTSETIDEVKDFFKSEEVAEDDASGDDNVSDDSDESGNESDIPTTPPEGLVENPNRPGSWGEIDKNGKFKEKWRYDKGRPEVKKGHGSKDHIHLDGKDEFHPVGGQK